MTRVTELIVRLWRPRLWHNVHYKKLTRFQNAMLWLVGDGEPERRNVIERAWNRFDLWWYLKVKRPVWNAWRWFPVIKHDEDCDWTGLAEVMSFKLKAMADLHQNHGHVVNSERYAKQMRTCAALLDRLVAEDYFDNAGHDFKTWDSLSDRKRIWIAKHSAYMAEQDTRYLGKIIGKYLRHWWD